MRIVTLEEHVRFSSFTDRIDSAAKEKRGYSKQARQPGIENWVRQLDDMAEERIRLMDESGITVQVLSVLGPAADLVEGEAGIAMAREYNDAVAEKMKAHPSRFAAFAHLPMTSPRAAADELARTVNEHGFVGALISGLTDDLFLDHESFEPILARAEQLKVPLYIHPGIPPKAVRDAYFSGLKPPVNMLLAMAGFGWHAETAVHVLRLIAAGCLDRHPTLQLIIGHMGEMLPMMLDRCDELFVPDFVGIERSLKQTILEQVHLTTSGVFSQPALKVAIDTFGIDRVMFSIDYPFSSNEEGRVFLDRIALAPADVARIAHGNADRLLKLT